MKIPRRFRYALAGLVLVVVAAGFWLCLYPRPRLSESVYNEIQVGMALTDVEKAVNAPGAPSDNATGTFNIFMSRHDGVAKKAVLFRAMTLPLSPASEAMDSDDAKWYLWRSPNRVLLVEVDGNSLIAKIHYECHAHPHHRRGRLHRLAPV